MGSVNVQKNLPKRDPDAKKTINLSVIPRKKKTCGYDLKGAEVSVQLVIVAILILYVCRRFI